MDRVFDQNYIETLCSELRTSINTLKAHMEQLNRAVDKTYSALDSVPGDVKDGTVDTAAYSLSAKVSEAQSAIKTFLDKMEGCRERALEQIPDADSQYAEQIQSLVQNVNNIREALAEVRDFLNTTPLTMGNGDFAVACEAMTEKCSRILGDARTQLDQIIANIKGAERISTAFSKDPVNLSTGNFIYEYTDIEIPGIIPFKFTRFYNAINHTKGVLGKDWNHNYEVHIFNEGTELVLIREDGKEERFIKTSIGTYASVYHSDGIISETDQGYVYETRKKVKYFFDKEGDCIKREDSEFVSVAFYYEPVSKNINNCAVTLKRLIKVERNTGESFTLEYDERNYLSAVMDHSGRKIFFQIDNDILCAVSTPSGHWYHYKYSISGKLSGVTDPRGIALVENEFDSKDRTTVQKFPDGGRMSYAYDDEKREIELTERNGSKIVYVHDEKYRDIRHVYKDGEERFEYNKLNQKTLVVDKLGNKTQFGYDNLGNLTRIINALGEKTTVQYNEFNKPVYIAINGREIIRSNYNKSGNLTESRDALGNLYKVEYDKEERPVKFIQPDGSETRLTYDHRGNITSLNGENGKSIKYSYDSLNRVVETIDGNGNVTKYEYDLNGNVIKETNATGNTRCYEYNESNKVTKITDYDGSTIYREYNSLNLLSKAVDQLGRETIYSYDSMWNLARVTLPDGSKTTYLYDENNRLGRIKDANGNSKRYTYDAVGNRIAEEDEEGNKTFFGYDALKRLTEITKPDTTKIHYEYDSYGNVTKISDSLGSYVQMIYNNGGQLVKEFNEDGESRSYVYTKLGRVGKVIDENGLTTEYVYDIGGQLRKIIYPDGVKESYEYDANGNVKQYIDGKGHQINYKYNCFNQIVQISDNCGKKDQYQYDNVGNMISMTDSEGNVTRYEYSLTGKLTKVVDACGSCTEYQYDDKDQLLSVCRYGDVKEDNDMHSKCQITRYERDLMGQVTKVTDPIGLSETYEYDKKGRLIEKIDKDGYLTKYGYNINGDLNHIQYEDGREVKLSYNALRQLQEVEDWLGVTKFKTNSKGNITEVTTADGNIVSYTYLDMGKRSSVIYPDNTKVEYNYDKYGRLISLIQDNKAITYEYDNFGQLCSKKYPNGTQTAYRYLDNGQLESLTHTDAEGILEQYIYGYDLSGNKVRVEKNRREVESENGIYTYRYDAVNRLTEVKKDGISMRKYTYDGFGNRTSVTECGSTVTYSYNDENQLISKADIYGETLYRYDKRGNLRHIFRDGVMKKDFFYGAINRLEQTIDDEGGISKYIYNGLGYRVGQEQGMINSAVVNQMQGEYHKFGRESDNYFKCINKIEYVLDLTRGYNNLLQKKEKESIQKYIWDEDVVAFLDEQYTDGAYYLQDELKSPIRLLDSGGNTVDTYGYDEFGRAMYANQDARQPFGFTGYQYDKISGVYFAQAREYDSGNGRFMAVDPYKGIMSNADTLNGYIYCVNNPLLYLDLMGFAPAWLEGIWAHIQIEKDLKNGRFACYNTKANAYIPGAGLGVTCRGFADFVVDKGTQAEIYEIKPVSYMKDAGLYKAAIRQLRRYIKYYPEKYDKSATEGKELFGNSIPYSMDPSRTLTYWSDGNGIIFYEISPKPEPDPLPKLQPEIPQLPEFNTKRFTTTTALAVTVFAVLYTTFTIVEDFGTGGLGILDDFTIPMVWTWAWSLWKGTEIYAKKNRKVQIN